MSRRKNGGFTLLEMVIVIVAASLVTLGATTTMLYGIRSNSSSMNAAKQQTTARMLLDTLENLSTKGNISGVVATTDAWMIYDGTETEPEVLYAYDSESMTISRGAEQTPVLENVIASYVNLSDKGVLTFSLETEEGTYTSSVYCRNRTPKFASDDISNSLGQSGGAGIDNIVTRPQNPGEVEDSRIYFLRVLANQYKMAGGQVNNGLILGADKTSTGKYYSEWYIGGYESNPGWNSQTPWCACYLSWALSGCKANDMIETAPREKWYASVDDFVAYFNPNNTTDFSKQYWIDNANYDLVRPGDLIVFDWNLDKDPSHIGAVLMIDGERVYTIEGNTSNRVGVRSYKLSDPRILGYGVIDWK